VSIVATEAAEFLEDFDRFACAAWSVVCPQPMVYELPQAAITTHLQAVVDGSLPIDTLVINVPPGSSKSLLSNVIWPAWLWARDPSCTVIAVSHTAALVNRFSAKFRLLIKSEWFQLRWPYVQLSKDTASKLSMRTTALGERIGVSAGGSITGSHADVIIVDDLVDAKDSNNTPAILARNEWHEEVLMSRWKNENHKLEVCIAQRLHESDLPAVLMARGATALVMPAMGPGTSTPVWMDPREGDELLAPKRLSKATLRSKQQTLGSAGYSAQYMQDPIPQSGGIVKPEWLAHEWSGVLPDGSHTYIVADTSHGENSDNDPTGLLVVSKHGASLRIIDYRTGVWDFPEQVAQLESAIKQYQPTCVYVEAAASGRSIVQTLRLRIPYIVGVPPHGPKETRLRAITPYLESGAVMLPEGAPWVPVFRKEVISFPRAIHDECVDVLSLACSRLLSDAPATGEVQASAVDALLAGLM